MKSMEPSSTPACISPESWVKMSLMSMPTRSSVMSYFSLSAGASTVLIQVLRVSSPPHPYQETVCPLAASSTAFQSP